MTCRDRGPLIRRRHRLMAMSYAIALLLGMLTPGDVAGLSFSEVPGGLLVGANPTSVILKDYDRDGLADIFVASAGTDAVELYRNIDGSHFSKASVIEVSGLFVAALADLNRDGLPDAIMGCADSLEIALATSPGMYGPPVGYYAAGYAIGRKPVAADLDHDGDVDVVAPLYGCCIALRFNDGTGRLDSVRYVLMGDENETVALGDLNNDDHLDLLVASGTLFVRFGNGDGTFGPRIVYSPLQVQGTSLAIDDLDDDGDVDVLVSGPFAAVIEVFWNSGGVLTNASPISTPVAVGVSSVVDLDLDGHDDIVAGSGGKVWVLRGLGGGVFGEAQSYPAINGPFDIAVGDINGDHKQDLVTANGNNAGSRLSIFHNATPTVGVGGVDATMRLGRARVADDRRSIAAECGCDGKAGRLEVMDVGGRRLGNARVEGQGGGTSMVRVDAGRRLAAGVYLVRLSCGQADRVRRVVVTP